MIKEDTFFVECFFKKMKEKNIAYCILRNSEEVALGDAHDIDMTVDINRIDQVYFLLMETAKELEWKVHLKMGNLDDKNNMKSYHFYKIKDSKPILIHFDIFPTFTWKGMVLLSNNDLLDNIKYRDIYTSANDGIESVTKLFIRLLHNGYIKEKYKEYIKMVFETNKLLVYNIMNKFLSSGIIDEIYDNVINDKWEDIEKNKSNIELDIKKNVKLNKDFKTNKIIYYKYLLKKLTDKPGIMIVFEGTDGSGKTTIIDNLPSILNRSFNEDKIKYYHWRPKFIKSPKKESGSNNIDFTNPHKFKPYGKIISFGKFIFFNLDYMLGYMFKIRVQLSKGNLVVFDRYYYDYYLDKVRYRLDISDRIIDLCKFFIPKPDVTYLLIGDAEILYNRKKEIPKEEIEKQIRRLIKNKDKFNNSVVIDVNNSIEDVINKVSTSILEENNKKY